MTKNGCQKFTLADSKDRRYVRSFLTARTYG